MSHYACLTSDLTVLPDVVHKVAHICHVAYVHKAAKPSRLFSAVAAQIAVFSPKKPILGTLWDSLPAYMHETAILYPSDRKS